MIRPPVLLSALAALLAPSAYSQVNIAPGGIATQSSDWGGAVAPRAIDGETDPSWFAGSIAHTDNLENSWWQVEFSGQLFAMSELRIFPRTDCCTERNSNLRVSVFQGATEVWGQDLYTTSGELNPTGEFLSLPAGIMGDRVRIQLLGFNLAGNGYLHLSEVEIEGQPTSAANFCGPAVPNSSGGSATIRAFGSDAVGTPLGLIAENMLSGEFGYFLIGNGTTLVNPPGSNGNLCILGSVLGRYNALDQIRNTQLGGQSFGLLIDSLQLPLNPAAPAMVGETWHFQAWFRDGASSNFSDALAITFQ